MQTVQSAQRKTLQDLAGKLLSSQTYTQAEKDKMIARLQGLSTDIDVEYLHALYFPETSHAARIPSRFGMPSSVFTQRFSFYINTGADGKGFAGIAPQDTTYISCFVGTSPLLNEINQIQENTQTFKFVGENSEYIADNFSYARLVGCSYRVSYIGTRDEESGFLCASHVFSSMPHLIDEQLIENGFFVTRKRPSEGVRMCYLPKDDADLEYEPQEFILRPSGIDLNVGVRNWLQDTRGDQILADDTDDHVVHTRQLGEDATGATKFGWFPLQDKANPQSPSHYWGIHNGKGQNQTPHMMAFYWRGMPANKDWLRVDVERHFEGIPREHIRDLVSTKRRGPSQRTIDFVKNKSSETKLHTHDLDDHEAMKAVVKPVIAHVADNHQVVRTTPKEDKSWTSTAADFLKGAAGSLGDMFGLAAPSLGSAVGTGIGTLLGMEAGPVGMEVGGALGGALGSAAGNMFSGVESVASDVLLGPTPGYGSTGSQGYAKNPMPQPKYQYAVY